MTDSFLATAASNGAFVWTPDEGRPGEENAALNEIDAGGRWRAARRAESATAAGSPTQRVVPSRARWPRFGCPICGVPVWALRRHLKVWHGA